MQGVSTWWVPLASYLKVQCVHFLLYLIFIGPSFSFSLFYGKTPIFGFVTGNTCNVINRWWTASQPDLHRPPSLLSGDDKKRDQVNELGVVLVYLRLACSLLKIVLVKVGYFWPKLCSFLQIMSLVLKLFISQNEKNKSKKHITIV